MQLKSFRLTNFRRLKQVRVDLENTTSIFVGANNSGKTSATHAFQLFLGKSKDRFSLYDFHVECWKRFDEIGVGESSDDGEIDLPSISLDLWFSVGPDDWHRVVDLLPSLDWDSVPVGLRIEYSPKDPAGLVDRFLHAKAEATGKKKGGEGEFHPWPQNLTEFLTRQLNSEYALHYYVLDFNQFNEKLLPKEGYVPSRLGDNHNRSGRQIIDSLLRVDFLNAQRHLSDTSISGGRAENLSSRFSRFYERNLEKHEDYDALRALADSESKLNEHLRDVFTPTLNSLSQLNYPGFDDPQLEIRSALKPESLLNQGAVVHYTIRDPNAAKGEENKISLPDRYNGLGYKNLIYMVIELLDFHERWADEESRAPLHIVFIEEPEAHLHVQLQQVFIRQVEKILDPSGKGEPGFSSQLIVTTHSPHILYEGGFDPIRYFCRVNCAALKQHSIVLNLSQFQISSAEGSDPAEHDSAEALRFLKQYMKLTHCDLFFADAAILVEGNVERLLLPAMIEKVAQELKSSYLSILEVGGAYAHLFKDLINFLGITTLVITDIDSIRPKQAEDDSDSNSLVCMTSEEGAITSNQTLRMWIPKLENISELLEASDEDKQLTLSGSCPTRVRVAYQTRQRISWEGETGDYAGRTLEEAFALENLEWTQELSRQHIGLRVVTKKDKLSLPIITEKVFKRVKGSGFKKTEFALGVLTEGDDGWQVPAYISEGLKWLSQCLAASGRSAPTIITSSPKRKSTDDK